MSLTQDQILAALPSLNRYARYLTRDEQSAADLVQESVVRALERAEGFRGESTPQTWLHRIMHNVHLDQARKRTPEPTADEELLAAVENAWRDDAYLVDADAVIERAAERDRLYDALAHLPVILRSAVVLHDLEGLTSPQIAEVHGIGVPAAKQRLRRGRALLVSLLAHDEERVRAMVGVPMRCWQARARIGDYLDGELPRDAATLLETHLATCPTCPSLYASVVGVRDAVGELRDPASVVPEDLMTRISRWRAESPGSQSTR